MKVVVTGAAGHVGSNLVRELLARGRQVRALVYRDRRGVEGLDVEVVEGDVTDVSSLRRAFDGAEVVYHLAAHISISSSRDPLLRAINVEGTSNVVEACLSTPSVRRLVHASSIHAYCQQPLDEPIDETRPLADMGPCSAYDRSKALGEREVIDGIDRGLDAVIAIPGAVIGPHDYKPSRIGRVILTMLKGQMPITVAGGYNWVDARDVAAGMIAAGERGERGRKYMLTGYWYSIRELGDCVQDVAGRGAAKLTVPLGVAALAGLPTELWALWTGKAPLFTPEAIRVLRGNSRYVHDRAAKELGYRPRRLADTVADTAEWFRQAGMA